jgi:hypothetical protein
MTGACEDPFAHVRAGDQVTIARDGEEETITRRVLAVDDGVMCLEGLILVPATDDLHIVAHLIYAGGVAIQTLHPQDYGR